MFLNFYQRQCSNVFKFNTEAHESLIFFQSNTSVVFPEKELIFNKDFLQAGIYYILIFYKLVILFFYLPFTSKHSHKLFYTYIYKFYRARIL